MSSEHSSETEHSGDSKKSEARAKTSSSKGSKAGKDGSEVNTKQSGWFLEKTIPGFSCAMCDKEDTETMVQCDQCDEWFHFDCVGVTSEIENTRWSCSECTNAKGVQTPISVSSSPTAGRTKNHNEQTPTGTKKKNRFARFVPPSPRPNPPQPNPAPTVPQPAPPTPRGVSPAQNKSSNDIPAPVDKQRTSKAPSVASSRMSQQALMKLKLQRLEEERELERREAEKEKKYLEQKYSLLEEMASERGSDRDSVKSKRVRDWVSEQGSRLNEPPDAFDPPQCSTDNSRPASERGDIEDPRDEDDVGNGNEKEVSDPRPRHVPRWNPSQPNSVPRHVPRWNPPQPNPVPRHVPCWNPHQLNPAPTRLQPQQNSLGQYSGTRNNTGQQNGEFESFDPAAPTQRQLAARQSVSKDLPVFSGNQEEWPVFLSIFNSTTSMCGYSNEENIVRLQRCLKGKAYDAVRSRLMHPSNVPGVIATLRMLFGQPEAIIQSLIARINAVPPLREDRLETVVDFAVNVENFVATVEACELDEHIYNISLLHQLVNKLPPTIKLDWAKHRRGLSNVNLATFGRWIYSLAEAASAVTIPFLSDDMKPPRNVRNDTKGGKKGNAFVNSHSEIPASDSTTTYDRVSSKTTPMSTETCPICKGVCKSADKCKRFQELSRDSRWAAVREFGLCRKCLRRHNGACKAKPCGKNGCTFKHHEMLHKDQSSQPTDVSTPAVTSKPNPQVGPNQPHSCNVHGSHTNSGFFRYLPVTLFNNDKAVSTYAFFDEGSELTLVDQELADELNLEGTASPLCLRWTGGDQRYEKNSRLVNLNIAGVRTETKKFQLNEVRTVKELLLPYQSLDMQELSQIYPHLEGIPIDSYRNIRPRILIGLKHARVGLVLRSREGKPEDPIATKTRLGWAVYGGNGQGAIHNLVHYTFHVCVGEEQSDEKLHLAMKEYFELDSVGITKKDSLLSIDDARALSLLRSLTKLENGRYQTGLLWKYDGVRLPDNREIALRRYRCLERRMQNDPKLAEALNQQIASYLAKGYLRQLFPEELAMSFPRIWYLPMFSVTNPNKPGKIRLVWDAAASAYGVSLNSMLVKGPDQLSSLLSIHIQFRQYRVGLTGDLREMFHQVNMRWEDQHCQRIFWTNDKGELCVFVLCVMTFGACCSPSSAQYVKNINAERFVEKYPLAVEVIQKRHYVDDMLVSVETTDEAITLAQEVKFVHAEGGFEIRNWLSNSQKVMAVLQENCSTEKNMDLTCELATEKILGMWWRTSTDTLTFKIGWNRFKPGLLSGELSPTKREVLRVLMSIFDPLGLVSHFLIFLKILLQDIWRSKIEWDEQISDKLLERWHIWLEVLPLVEKVEISRCYRSRTSLTDDLEVQMHTFVDASDSALAAAVYLRFIQGDVIECALVAAKTRVASLKLVSIPRLELQAALIGARLAKTVAESLTIPIGQRFYWTDNRDVMCWINSDHRRYSQFVGFRVTEILELTDSKDWYWIQSKENVADMGTKWKGPPDLSTGSKWFQGPDFLWQSMDQWKRSVDS